jgi:hypothetical protein
LENGGVAEASQALDASLGGALLVAGIVVSGAEVFEGSAGCEHVVDGDGELVGDGEPQ